MSRETACFRCIRSCRAAPWRARRRRVRRRGRGVSSVLPTPGGSGEEEGAERPVGGLGRRRGREPPRRPPPAPLRPGRRPAGGAVRRGGAARSRSPSISRSTGIPVQRATTAATSESSTSSRSRPPLRVSEPGFGGGEFPSELADGSVAKLRRPAEVLFPFGALHPQVGPPRSARGASVPRRDAPSRPATGCAAPVPRLRGRRSGARGRRAASGKLRPFPSSAPRVRSAAKAASAPLRRARWGHCPSRCGGGRRLRPPGQSPCRGGIGPRCSARTSRAAARSALSWMRTPWVDLVALLEAAQDRHGCRESWVRPPARSGTGVRGRRPSRYAGGYSSRVVAPMQCSSPRARAGFSRFEASMAPLGPARADDGVELVEEQDDRPLRCGHRAQHRLEPLLELAPELRPGDQRSHVEGDHPLAAQPLGDIALDDAEREPPRRRRSLPTPGSPMSTGLFLVRAGEDLHDAPDLVVAADHRVQPVLAGQPGQVAPVSLQRLIGALRVRGGRPRGPPAPPSRPLRGPFAPPRRRRARGAAPDLTESRASARCSTLRYSSPSLFTSPSAARNVVVSEADGGVSSSPGWCRTGKRGHRRLGALPGGGGDRDRAGAAAGTADPRARPRGAREAGVPVRVAGSSARRPAGWRDGAPPGLSGWDGWTYALLPIRLYDVYRIISNRRSNRSPGCRAPRSEARRPP